MERSNLPARGGAAALKTFPAKLFYKSIFLVTSFFFVLSWLLFIINLPSVSNSSRNTMNINPRRLNKHFLRGDQPSWGFFGEKMLGMLPEDLPFTVFVPLEQHFRRILRPENVTEKKWVNSTSDNNNTMAIISRILGFSAAPMPLLARSVPLNGEVEMDSLSGFRLQIGRSSHGVLYVNNLRCEITDLRRGQIVVHLVGGVAMDAEFEQSLISQDDDFD